LPSLATPQAQATVLKSVHSIRARLWIVLVSVLVVILAIAAWASYEVSKHEARELFGARLATSARVLEALVAKQIDHATLANPIVTALPKQLENLSEDEESPLGHRYETKIAFQVLRDDGALLVRSASAPAQPFSRNMEGFSRQNVAGAFWEVFVLRSGNSWIQVAEKTEVRDELIHDLGVAVMTPLIAGAVFLLVVVNLLVGYGLSPLGKLATAIANRNPDALRPLEIGEVPVELAPVVRALNDLLSRVSLAFEHERRFTDAAAHELRTPLAALRIHVDNVKLATGEAECTKSMAQLSQGLERAIKLADQMLAYSRAQDAQDRDSNVAIRLFDAVAESLTSIEPLRRERSQRIRIVTDAAGENADILGEPLKIQRLIGNLLDNACRYALPASEIEVRISRGDNQVLLSVLNHGNMIPPDLRARVFEPYYRIPGSPSEGNGLGLAIVKELANQHGATVTISAATANEGTVVIIAFPARVPVDSE